MIIKDIKGDMQMNFDNFEDISSVSNSLSPNDVVNVNQNKTFHASVPVTEIHRDSRSRTELTPNSGEEQEGRKNNVS